MGREGPGRRHVPGYADQSEDHGRPAAGGRRRAAPPDAARAGADLDPDEAHLARVVEDDIRDPVTEDYTPGMLVTGYWIGSAADAHDTAALIRLTGYQK